MKIKIKNYPYNKDYVFAITIDDLHPEGREDLEGLDFGKDIQHGNLKYLSETIKKIPNIKITLFTVANWIDREEYPKGIFLPLRKVFKKRIRYTNNPFKLDRPEHKLWTNQINSFYSKNIEIAFHGYEHFNPDLTVPKSCEFTKLSFEKTLLKIKLMEKIFENSGLKYIKGFRPPGWGLNNYLYEVLQKRGYLYIAASCDVTTKISLNSKTNEAGLKGQNIIKENYLKNKLINFVANCYPSQIDRAVEIAKNKGILIVHSHITKTCFGLKAVDKRFSFYIQRMLKEIKYQTLYDPWFATLGELAKFIYSRNNIKYNIIDSDKIKFINNSIYPIRGLTIEINNNYYIINEIKANSEYILKIKGSKKNSKKTSVILTVYNGESTIEESLNSLCKQTYKNLEIIVVDDGSTDNTLKIIDNYINKTNDKRIKLIVQNNRGRANAKNRGFLESTGEIITFCEDDAIYDKNYIMYSVKHFRGKNPKIGGVIGPHYVWNRNDSLNTKIKDLERRRNFYNYKPNSCWFYERKTFQQIGMFDENLEFGEDVVPAIKLKEMGYKFIYEERARWLHKEPASLIKYLRRKFRGGIGMASLKKAKLKRNIIPLKYKIFLFLLIIIFLLFLLLNNKLTILLVVIIIILGLIRIKDIYITKKVAPNENYLFIIFSIYYEYIWWIATFCGYLYGLTLSKNEILDKLKGR